MKSSGNVSYRSGSSYSYWHFAVGRRADTVRATATAVRNILSTWSILMTSLPSLSLFQDKEWAIKRVPTVIRCLWHSNVKITLMLTACWHVVCWLEYRSLFVWSSHLSSLRVPLPPCPSPHPLLICILICCPRSAMDREIALLARGECELPVLIASKVSYVTCDTFSVSSTLHFHVFYIGNWCTHYRHASTSVTLARFILVMQRFLLSWHT